MIFERFSNQIKVRLVALAVLISILSFVSPCEAYTTQSEAAKAGQSLGPQQVYEGAWQFLNSEGGTGIDVGAWQEWRHKFDGQLKDDASLVVLLSTALDNVRGPKVSLDLAFWPPAEAGIGLNFYVNKRNEIEVARTSRGGSAALAGMKRGDIITSVDGIAVGPWLMTTLGSLRGTGVAGSTVRVQYRRAGTTYEVDLKRTKKSLAPETVCLMIDGIAYVRPPDSPISIDDAQFLKSALAELPSTGAKGLVFDLRDSDVVVQNNEDMAGYFLPKDTVLRVQSSGGLNVPYKSSVDPVLASLPVVVLTNRGTMYNSELIAGAIQHYKRGQIVGDRSCGLTTHGLRSHQIDKIFAVNIAMFDYVPPNGISIEGRGVQPDLLVPDDRLTADDAAWYLNIKPGATPSPDLKNKSGEILDMQLREALKVLKSQLSN